MISVVRLTFKKNADLFPAVNLGRILYENLGSGNDIFSLYPGKLEPELVQRNARFPDISEDGTKLVYSAPGGGIYIADLDGNKLSNNKKIASDSGSGDPQISSDNSLVIYHYKNQGDNGARTRILNLKTNETTEITEDIGCGHAAFNIDSTKVICGLSSNSIIKQWDFNTLTDLVPDYGKSVFAGFDSRYEGCDGIIISYPEFCKDNNHIIGSVQCLEAKEPKATTLFSELFLFELEGNSVKIHDIHKDFEGFLGVSDKESMTVACS